MAQQIQWEEMKWRLVQPITGSRSTLWGEVGPQLNVVQGRIEFIFGRKNLDRGVMSNEHKHWGKEGKPCEARLDVGEEVSFFLPENNDYNGIYTSS